MECRHRNYIKKSAETVYHRASALGSFLLPFLFLLRRPIVILVRFLLVIKERTCGALEYQAFVAGR